MPRWVQAKVRSPRPVIAKGLSQVDSPDTARWIASIRLKKPRKNRFPAEPIGSGCSPQGSMPLAVQPGTS